MPEPPPPQHGAEREAREHCARGVIGAAGSMRMRIIMRIIIIMRIGMLVDMDGCTLSFFRDDVVILDAVNIASHRTVCGFPTAGVRLAACCKGGTITLLCGRR
jgi:hypothetical protein